MKVIIEKTYKELSETLAAIMISEMTKIGRVNIDCTDGVSPQGAYDIVEKKIAEDPTRYHNVHYYNHAEAKGNELVATMLQDQVFTPFQVPKENIHLMDFDNPYEHLKDLENAGGLDLQVLGLGADGHFCVNYPGATIFDRLVYSYDPKDFFWYDDLLKQSGLDTIPDFLTFGFKMVNKSKRVVMIINGKNKAQAVKDLFTKPISPDTPGTILRCMDNLTLILDGDSASLLTDEDLKSVTL